MRVLVHILTNIEGRVGVVVSVVTSIPRIEKDKLKDFTNDVKTVLLTNIILTPKIYFFFKKHRI